MAEIDKIIQQASQVMSWLRAGKDNEGIRAEMYSAAAKTCLEMVGRIEQMQGIETEE